MESQPNTYTFRHDTTDGQYVYTFSGDVGTSSFISNYIKDMNVSEGDVIELECVGHRDMSIKNLEQFLATWTFLTTTHDGVNFAKNINPDYFEDKEKDMTTYLPSKLYELLKPDEQDIEEHKKFLESDSIISYQELETNTYTKTLLCMMPLMKMVKYINYANFLGIDNMIGLFAKLIADYVVVFVKVRRQQQESEVVLHRDNVTVATV